MMVWFVDDLFYYCNDFLCCCLMCSRKRQVDGVDANVDVHHHDGVVIDVIDLFLVLLVVVSLARRDVDTADDVDSWCTTTRRRRRTTRLLVLFYDWCIL